MRPHVLHLQLQLGLRATGSALEGHVLQEVGHAIGLWGLKAATSIDPQADLPEGRRKGRRHNVAVTAQEAIAGTASVDTSQQFKNDQQQLTVHVRNPEFSVATLSPFPRTVTRVSGTLRRESWNESAADAAGLLPLSH